MSERPVARPVQHVAERRPDGAFHVCAIASCPGLSSPYQTRPVLGDSPTHTIEDPETATSLFLDAPWLRVAGAREAVAA